MHISITALSIEHLRAQPQPRPNSQPTFVDELVKRPARIYALYVYSISMCDVCERSIQIRILI
jgi:hypothetical protein